jgi:hypothetical protein
MNKAPLSRVNEEFGGKDKLVDAIVNVVERGDEDKEALRKRLQVASNSKLIRLLRTAQQMKEIGGREKLIDSLADTSGKSKDKDFRARLAGFTSGQLLDQHRARTRASARQSAPAKSARKAAPTAAAAKSSKRSKSKAAGKKAKKA